MTRLDQALRWWRGHDGTPIPARHLETLNRNRCLKMVFASNEECVLTPRGESEMKDAVRRARESGT